MATDAPSSRVQAAVQGRLGILTLDRPEALNALDLGMVEQLDGTLVEWTHDSHVHAVLIRSSGERAFCAGGDMRAIGTPSDPSERVALGRAFFAAEYRLNYRINMFPKPFVALVDGIAMGGGLGLSVHGSHRVVGENLRMAMPETALGLFPDVGSTWFLTRCPGSIGRYLALVGAALTAADALTAGLATHHVPRSSFARLVSELAAADRLDMWAVDGIVGGHAAAPEKGGLAVYREEIDRLFGGDDLDAVVAAVQEAEPGPGWIADANSALRHASPTSLRATWRRMVESATHPIERVLADDYRMAVRIVGGHDFAEGVRAVLVDKDRSARWSPETLGQVGTGAVDALLADLPGTPDFATGGRAE